MSTIAAASGHLASPVRAAPQGRKAESGPRLSSIYARHPAGVSGHSQPRCDLGDLQALDILSVAPDPSPQPRRSHHRVQLYALPTPPNADGSAHPAKASSPSNVSEEF